MFRGRQSSDYLFREIDWFAYQQHATSELQKEINEVDADRLLNTSQVDLAEFFRQKYFLDLPVLQEEEISVDCREADIDVSHRFDYGGYGRQGHHTVKGEEYEIHIPFSGDPDLFKFRPTTFSSSVPKAAISGHTILHFIQDVNITNEAVERSVDKLVADINQHLNWLRGSVVPWNERLLETINSVIAARREKLIAQRTSAANLKFKMRPRPGVSSTYVTPKVRRKVTPVMPPPGQTPWKPEPVLDMQEYQHILGIITNAALTWERSPAAFGSMGEEDLRTQFLFHLNGHYESQATGETFNKEGKTDILIRDKGRNIFIGECKFWGGAKVLTETIDQILGYTSWRDTKAAIIIFNRNKNFSSVLEQIKPVVTSHPKCKGFLSSDTESQFRFMFVNKDDDDRELTLTVLAFDVPQDR